MTSQMNSDLSIHYRKNLRVSLQIRALLNTSV